MSTDERDRAQEHEDVLERTAAPMVGEEQEDLPTAKYRDVEASAGDPVEARLEQRREMDTAGATVGPTGGVMTDAQGRGAMVGGLVGATVGLVLMVVIALLVPIADLELAVRLVIFGAVGLFGGGVVGAVYGGGRNPELEGEASDADVDAPVSPSSRVLQVEPNVPGDSTR